VSSGPQSVRPLLLFSPDRELGAEARHALAAAGPVRSASSWTAFRKQATGSLCAVAVLAGDGGMPEHTEELAAFRSAAPVVPLVLVTREDPEMLRTLAPVPVDEVVWLGEMPEALALAARRAVSRGWRRRMSWTFGLSAGVPRVLREALALAARAGVPFRSVSALGDAAGADRRTLWRAWREATDGEGARGLKEVLGWLLLLRAMRLRDGGLSWSAAADRLEVGPKALRRTSRSLMDVDLRGLGRAGIAAVVEGFERRVLIPLEKGHRRDRVS